MGKLAKRRQLSADEGEALAVDTAVSRTAKQVERTVVEATQAVTNAVTLGVVRTGEVNAAEVKAMVDTWRFCHDSGLIFRGRNEPPRQDIATVEVDWDAVNATVDQLASDKSSVSRKAANKLMIEAHANT